MHTYWNLHYPACHKGLAEFNERCGRSQGLTAVSCGTQSWKERVLR